MPKKLSRVRLSRTHPHQDVVVHILMKKRWVIFDTYCIPPHGERAVRLLRSFVAAIEAEKHERTKQ